MTSELEFSKQVQKRFKWIHIEAGKIKICFDPVNERHEYFIVELSDAKKEGALTFIAHAIKDAIKDRYNVDKNVTAIKDAVLAQSQAAYDRTIEEEE